MSEAALPFNPLRHDLYSPDDLFAGFDPGDPTSYARCADMAILSYFARMRANSSMNSGASTLEALHDNSISKAIQVLTVKFPTVVAIMGGHGMKRSDPAYTDVAHIAHELAKSGFLLTSGGGPGAMEATHLGALLSKRSVAEVDAAIAVFKTVDSLPANMGNLVKPDGKIDAEIAKMLHAWITPALKIRNEVPVTDRAISLGVPTWLYGFEPTTPFATHCGKYFQNSIREDGLVTLGVSGIIYAEGSAGTVQEIFQDAAQNYYATFCPMIFLSSAAKDGEHFWEKKLPVRPLIEALLGSRAGFSKVLFSERADEVIAFIKEQ
jgi:predicted Rossmann-fold nucleotide-binding protein